MGFYKDTVKGVSWVIAQRWVIRGLTFIRIAVLARLLTPSQFGIFGFANISLGLLEIITETWINVFLVQEKGEIDNYLNTAWVISIFRGFLIFLLMLIGSGPISHFFGSPQSKDMILILSLVPLIRGFINPAIAKMQKLLQFKKEFYFRSVLFVIESLVSVVIALIYRTPVGLAVGVLVGSLFEVFLSMWLFFPRPRLTYQSSLAGIILNRGKWITAAGIFNYLFQNGDNLVVGKMLGAASLGIYDFSYKISSAPISEISDVISRVTFPVYVNISSRLPRLVSAFIKTSLIVSVFSVTLGVFIFIFARPIVLFVLGSGWLAAVPVLKILSIAGAAKSVTNTIYPFFLATKNQNYITVITLVSLIGLGISIIPLIHLWGLIGAGLAVIVGAFSTLPVSFYFIFKILHRHDFQP